MTYGPVRIKQTENTFRTLRICKRDREQSLHGGMYTIHTSAAGNDQCGKNARQYLSEQTC